LGNSFLEKHHLARRREGGGGHVSPVAADAVAATGAVVSAAATDAIERLTEVDTLKRPERERRKEASHLFVPHCSSLVCRKTDPNQVISFWRNWSIAFGLIRTLVGVGGG
jgi:hypothetical protein